jgi:homoserine O-succinyltransferase
MTITARHGMQVERVLRDAEFGTRANETSCRQGGQRLRIVLINLMPEKARTENQFHSVLASAPQRVDLMLVRPATHHAKTTNIAYLERFYNTWNEIRAGQIDGVIVTGAPVETLPFEEVTYWRELQDIFNDIRARAIPALHICWGAQAALYHFHQVPKHVLKKKTSGVFSQQVFRHGSACVAGLGSGFQCPVSRHTETRWRDIVDIPGLHVAAASEATGLCLVEDEVNRSLYMFNHLEYDGQALSREFLRDVHAGKPAQFPQNLVENTDPGRFGNYSWRETGHLFFSNWITSLVDDDANRTLKNN